MTPYIPVLILLLVGAGLGTVVLLLTSVLGPRRPNAIKNSVYECGVPTFGTARHRVSVKFYLVAILFLLFDVEAVFFYPWAIVFKKFLEINGFILIEMLTFVAVLVVGYVYVVRKGALDWD